MLVLLHFRANVEIYSEKFVVVICWVLVKVPFVLCTIHVPPGNTRQPLLNGYRRALNVGDSTVCTLPHPHAHPLFLEKKSSRSSASIFRKPPLYLLANYAQRCPALTAIAIAAAAAAALECYRNELLSCSVRRAWLR